jgi:hypothetical protein
MRTRPLLGSAHSTRIALVGGVLAAMLAATITPTPAHAADPPPCWTCGGTSTGQQIVFGGSYHTRVKPPASPGQGATTTTGFADCSHLYLPLGPFGQPNWYHWPKHPMPCADITFTYVWQHQPCPGTTAQMYVEEMFYPTVGTWVDPARAPLCLTAPDFLAAGVAPPPGLMAVSVWKRMSFPDPAVGVKPAVKGLVNLASYFWVAGPHTQTDTVNVGPYTLAVTGTVIDYTWEWGDGSPALSTNDPGKPWPNGQITHTFRQSGSFAVSVTTGWHGTFRINGGAPIPVLGPGIARTSAVDYAVQQLDVVLTR